MLEVFRKLKLVAAASSDEEEQQQRVEEAKSIIQDICNEHVFAADSLIRDSQLRNELIQETENECQELSEYITVAKRFNLEVNSRSKDRVCSFGEKLSCRFMTHLLRDKVCAAGATNLHRKVD